MLTERTGPLDTRRGTDKQDCTIRPPSQVDLLINMLELDVDTILRVGEEIENRMHKVAAGSPDAINGTVKMMQEAPRSELARQLHAIHIRLNAAIIRMQDLNSRIEL